MFDEILQKYNLKYEDLLEAERETLYTWISVLQQNQVTVEKIREYIESMKFAVEDELSKTGHENKHDILLKARLRNYMLLEAFLTSPEKARIQMERAVASFAKRI